VRRDRRELRSDRRHHGRTRRHRLTLHGRGRARAAAVGRRRSLSIARVRGDGHCGRCGHLHPLHRRPRTAGRHGRHALCRASTDQRARGDVARPCQVGKEQRQQEGDRSASAVPHVGQSMWCAGSGKARTFPRRGRRFPYSTAMRVALRSHHGSVDQSSALRSSCALMATMTVLADISTAPTAGDSTNPQRASSPAASGMAMTL